jgi:hypothetical protein
VDPPKPKPRPATRRRSAISQRTLSPADQKKILGEWYNMTKKAHGGDHDQKLASKEKPKGKNCPLVPKPPNTAKAIADKAGHRSPARARIDHCGVVVG